jgi:hypothetical protein
MRDRQQLIAFGAKERVKASTKGKAASWEKAACSGLFLFFPRFLTAALTC